MVLGIEQRDSHVSDKLCTMGDILSPGLKKFQVTDVILLKVTNVGMSVVLEDETSYLSFLTNALLPSSLPVLAPTT